MRVFSNLSCLLLVFFAAACQKEDPDLIPQKIELQEPLMGTLFQVTTFATDLPRARKMIQEAFEKAHEIEKVATDYNPRSELNRLCASPPNTPMPVSKTLFELLEIAHRTAQATKGAYDPTLGPLTRLWRESLKTRSLPSEIRLKQARSVCGYHALVLDSEEQTVMLRKNGMQLDLGGIAKGYAADVIFNHLKDAGLSQTLVAAGGDLRIGEAPPEKNGWTIGLRTFHLTPSSTKTLVECAVSTSGDLHQSIEIGGIRYAHLIDPQTGLGQVSRVAATVIAPLAVQTDPLATAACLHPDPQELFKEFPEASFRILTESKMIPPVRNGVFLNN